MKLMVCYDGSNRAQVALGNAIELFRSKKPEIILVTVVEEPVDPSSHDEESFQAWKEKREKDLNEMAEWVTKQGLDVDAILAVGDPRKMLVEAAKKKNPDVLVVARRGGGVLGEEMVLGSVSAYLVRHVTNCPVLVMR